MTILKRMILVLACLTSAAASGKRAKTPADAKPEVSALGTFSETRSTEEHTYGMSVKLWSYDRRVIGKFTYWGGQPEGTSGLLEHGEFDTKSGTLRFKTVLLRHDLGKPEPDGQASFKGTLRKGRLSGILHWHGVSDERSENGGKQKIRLHKDPSEPEQLKDYPTQREWLEEWSL